MTVAEQARHRLHAHLEEIMGEEHPAAVMGWLPHGLMASQADVQAAIADLRSEMYRGFTRQTWGLVTGVSVINGLMLAAMRLV